MQVLRTVFLLALVAVFETLPCKGQESASYRLREHAVNAGGVPSQGDVHTSAQFKLTLESIAGPLAHRAAGSESYGAEGGFVPGLHPATEVTGLRFADGDTLTWDGHLAAGTFRVYRDALADVGPALGDCLDQDIAGATADDPATPAPGTGYAYVVTVANTLGEEGTPGGSSSGVERALVTPCP